MIYAKKKGKDARNQMDKDRLNGLLVYGAGAAPSLTTDQFVEMCRSVRVECRANRIAQAHVGGALDLIETLNRETSYLSEFYCKEPEELLQVPLIIDFILDQKPGYEKRNAMLLVIRYLEENGGC
jgi:hypothetical protein